MNQTIESIIIFSLLLSCNNPNTNSSNGERIMTMDSSLVTNVDSLETQKELKKASISDTSFVFLDQLSNDFSYDLKYATTDNFIKTKVYSCDRCLIRKEVALALIDANQKFLPRGFRIKFYDCYRPLSVQKAMWKVFPDSKYVADPTYGSIHNRGGAVDITLVDANGSELAMGTKFDHFGIEAHHSYQDLPDSVIMNRVMLKEIMESSGFSPIASEWWHYNFINNGSQYPVSDFETSCD